jgi:Zn finger protein HypA/HybF involved in hydrogenase expression
MTELAVLTCTACGAPVPLRDGDVATCNHCSRSVPIPAEHRARHAELEEARADRRHAEAAMRELPRPLPPWAGYLAPWLIVLVLPAWIVVAILGWVFWGWFPTPLHMLGWGIFTPIFVAMFVMIDVAAASSYSRRMGALGATHDRGAWSCRRCGSPLALELDALTTTCDYCKSDNLLRDPGPRFRALLGKERAAAAAKLSDVLWQIRESRANRRGVRIIVGAVLFPFWLLFTGPLIWQWFG